MSLIAMSSHVAFDALRRHRVGMYAVALLFFTSVAIAALVAMHAEFGPALPVIALSILALYAERQSVQVSTTTQLSVGFLPIVFAAVVFGPLAAAAVGALGLVGDLRRPYVRWTIWTFSRALCGLAAGIGPWIVGVNSHSSFGLVFLAVGLAAVTEVVGDFALNAMVLVVRGTGSLPSVTKTLGPILFAAVPLYTPVIAVLAFAYFAISPWTLALFVIPALAAQRLFVLYREQRETAAQLATANEMLQRAGLSFAGALVATLDARDRYTAGHSAAVAIYSRDIARRMGLSEEEQQLVHLCGLVHDIGKIGLPPGLLEKPGPLTLEERRVMEEHSMIGERILQKVDNYREIATVVRHHHERVDGNGYPDGLVSGEIPLLSRIIAVADAYNAMTSDRPYRDAMPSRVARLRLAQAVESQFDTSVVAAFEAILAGADEPYRSGLELKVRLSPSAVAAPASLAVA
jgi:putative nucleotidyltransferase with HDIG domain